MSDEPTVAVMPPHAEFCDWSLSDDPCNCGLDDFVAVMVAQARREGAAEALRSAAAEASWMEYPASKDPTHWATWLRNRAAALRGDV